MTSGGISVDPCKQVQRQGSKRQQVVIFVEDVVGVAFNICCCSITEVVMIIAVVVTLIVGS